MPEPTADHRQPRFGRCGGRSRRAAVREARFLRFLVLLALPWVATPGLAQRTPVAVSPGGENATLIATSCPTFTWGSLAGAESVELVVLRLDGAVDQEEPALRRVLAGSATGWTPPLADCLERGARYAWSVRALAKEEPSPWAELKQFQIAAAPSREDFEAALTIVRAYLEQEPTGPLADSESDGAGTPTSEAPASTRSARRLTTPVVGATKLSVSGGVVATSFTGDGSTLTSLSPTNLTSGTASINVSGSAGSVSCTGCIGANQIAANAVGSAEIAASAVGTSEIANRSITYIDLSEDAVGQFELGDNSVTGQEHVVNGSIGSADIGNGAITNSHLYSLGIFRLKSSAYCESQEIDTNSGTPAFCPQGKVMIGFDQEEDCGTNDACVTRMTCARPCEFEVYSTFVP